MFRNKSNWASSWMVRVKFYGILRLNTGKSELEVEANRVDQAIQQVAAQSNVGIMDLKRCTILVNGKQARMRSKLAAGDMLVFLSPAGGG